MTLYQAGETTHTSKCKPCVAIQDKNQKQKECVFAWRVLLRNVTSARIPEGHHRWTPEKKEGSSLCACSNLNEKQQQHISKRALIHEWSMLALLPSLVRDCGLSGWMCFFIFKLLYTIMTCKSNDAISNKGHRQIVLLMRNYMALR